MHVSEPRDSISHASSLPLESAGLLGCVDCSVGVVLYRRRVTGGASGLGVSPVGRASVRSTLALNLLLISGARWLRIVEIRGRCGPCRRRSLVVAGGREWSQVVVSDEVRMSESASFKALYTVRRETPGAWPPWS